MTEGALWPVVRVPTISIRFRPGTGPVWAGMEYSPFAITPPAVGPLLPSMGTKLIDPSATGLPATVTLP